MSGSSRTQLERGALQARFDHWFIWRVESVTRIRPLMSPNEKCFNSGTKAALTNDDVAV
jgi:hypothetical protein